MSLKIATVWSSIAALSVSGITIKDIDDVSETWEVRGPVLYPLVDQPVSIEAPERVTFGTGNTPKRDVRYTLYYRYLHAPVGSERGIKGIYSTMFTNVAAIFNAITTNDALTGSIDIAPRISSTDTVVSDPSGNMFYGIDIAFDVLEYFEL